MPNVADGQSVTITVAERDVVSVLVNGGAVRYENPVGTVVMEFGADRTFGPLVAGAIKLTSIQGGFTYDVGYVDYPKNQTVRAVTLDDLPATGIFYAHRGTARDGKPFGLEGSKSAYMTAAALGAPIIDGDVRATRDGVLVVGLHDANTGTISAVDVVAGSTALVNMPQHYQPALVGSGWAAEDFITVDELFQKFGGRVVIDLELKGGIADVPAFATLVRKYGLQNSVLCNTASSDVAAAIVAYGLKLHFFNCTTTALIDLAAKAGAWMIDIPTDASASLVSYALSQGFQRVISGFVNTAGTPVSTDTFAAIAARDSRLHGYASNALGYLGRPGGEAKRSSDSIIGAIRTGRRGAGWKVINSGNLTDWLSPGNLYLRKGAGAMVYTFGDVSGAAATTGTITAKFIFDTLPTTTSQYAALKLFSPTEDPANPSSDTIEGYKLGLLADGTVFLNRAPVGGGGFSSVHANITGGGSLVAGTEYAVKLEWDDSTPGVHKVRTTRVDTGGTSGWITEGSTYWRGNYHSAYTTLSDGQLRITDLAIT